MNSLTVAELKKLAKSKGLKGYSTLRRGELMSLLGKGKKRSPVKSRSVKRRSVKRSPVKSRSVKRSAKSRSPVKQSAGSYLVSIKPYFTNYFCDAADIPSEAEIKRFIQTQSIKAIKENITHVQQNMGANNFNYNASTGTIHFKLPGTLSRNQVLEYLQDLRHDSLGMYYEGGEPGKGLRVASKSKPKRDCGVIDYRKAIKLEN